jgi:hypothetical protein
LDRLSKKALDTQRLISFFATYLTAAFSFEPAETFTVFAAAI